jgi:hypothetical protein
MRSASSSESERAETFAGDRAACIPPLAWPFPYPARLAVIQLLNFPKGILSMLLARGMFYLLGVPAHWAILPISITWISI